MDNGVAIKMIVVTKTLQSRDNYRSSDNQVAWYGAKSQRDGRRSPDLHKSREEEGVDGHVCLSEGVPTISGTKWPDLRFDSHISTARVVSHAVLYSEAPRYKHPLQESQYLQRVWDATSPHGIGETEGWDKASADGGDTGFTGFLRTGFLEGIIVMEEHTRHQLVKFMGLNRTKMNVMFRRDYREIVHVGAFEQSRADITDNRRKLPSMKSSIIMVNNSI